MFKRKQNLEVVNIVLLFVFICLSYALFGSVKVGFRLAEAHPPIDIPAMLWLPTVYGMFCSIACIFAACAAGLLSPKHPKAARLVSRLLIVSALILAVIFVIGLVQLEALTGSGFGLWFSAIKF